MKSPPLQKLILALLVFGLINPSVAQKTISPSESPLVSTEDQICDLINKIDGVNRKNQDATCSRSQTGPEITLPAPTKTSHNTTPPTVSPASEVVTIKDANGDNIQVSVVSEEKAKELFKRIQQENLANRNYIVCAQRGLIISHTLEREGIHSAKLFAKPGWFGSIVPDFPENKKGHIAWDFHTAPFIYVRKDNQIIPMVFDPGAFSEPVSQSRWEEFLKSHPNSSYSRTLIASQYTNDLKQLAERRTKYNPEEIMRAREILDQARADKLHRRD